MRRPHTTIMARRDSSWTSPRRLCCRTSASTSGSSSLHIRDTLYFEMSSKRIPSASRSTLRGERRAHTPLARLQTAPAPGGLAIRATRGSTSHGALRESGTRTCRPARPGVRVRAIAVAVRRSVGAALVPLRANEAISVPSLVATAPECLGLPAIEADPLRLHVANVLSIALKRTPAAGCHRVYSARP